MSEKVKDGGPAIAHDLLAPGAIPTVDVQVPADRWDNIVREWGVGYCCEWFGHQYDSFFSMETARILIERTHKREHDNALLAAREGATHEG